MLDIAVENRVREGGDMRRAASRGRNNGNLVRSPSLGQSDMETANVPASGYLKWNPISRRGGCLWHWTLIGALSGLHSIVMAR